MAYDDSYSQRAAKGQAFNLAVLTAIADGKQHDNEFIVKQFLRHLQFGSLLQKANPEQLAGILSNPKLIKPMLTHFNNHPVSHRQRCFKVGDFFLINAHCTIFNQTPRF